MDWALVAQTATALLIAGEFMFEIYKYFDAENPSCAFEIIEYDDLPPMMEISIYPGKKAVAFTSVSVSGCLVAAVRRKVTEMKVAGIDVRSENLSVDGLIYPETFAGAVGINLSVPCDHKSTKPTILCVWLHPRKRVDRLTARLRKAHCLWPLSATQALARPLCPEPPREQKSPSSFDGPAGGGVDF